MTIANCICQRESNPEIPCPVPCEAHFRGIEIEEGPIIEIYGPGKYDRRTVWVYFKIWWDFSRRRSRGQIFKGSSLAGNPDWVKAVREWQRKNPQLVIEQREIE